MSDDPAPERDRRGLVLVVNEPSDLANDDEHVTGTDPDGMPSGQWGPIADYGD